MAKQQQKEQRKKNIYRIVQTLKVINTKNKAFNDAEEALYKGKTEQAELAMMRFFGVETDRIELKHITALDKLAAQLGHLHGANNVSQERVIKYISKLKATV